MFIVYVTLTSLYLIGDVSIILKKICSVCAKFIDCLILFKYVYFIHLRF